MAHDACLRGDLTKKIARRNTANLPTLLAQLTYKTGLTALANRQHAMTVMPILYFDLVSGAHRLTDPEGVECIDLAGAKEIALSAARDIVSADAAHGKIDLTLRINVRDADDREVHSLAFKDAFGVKIDAPEA